MLLGWLETLQQATQYMMKISKVGKHMKLGALSPTPCTPNMCAGHIE
jgi:hypothetical protein